MISSALGAGDLWDLAPIHYSDAMPSDAVAMLAADLASGKKALAGSTDLERLKFVLNELDVPQESQVLVYSKTSHQNPLIRPSDPRALYFSMNTYVGYVPGGDIEVIVQDRVLGPVFYLIKTVKRGGLEIERDLTTCLSCHGTTATLNVPGMQVRSVIPDEDGHPLLAMGTSQVDYRTAMAERWGGYYVTGRASMPHLGNRVYQNGAVVDAQASNLTDLNGIIDMSRYPRATSDVVALMVLEHQCRMHNLLTAASMRYRRAFYLGRAADAQANPDDGAAGRVADGSAEEIVDCLFFKDEANPGEDTEGGAAFQQAFAKALPTAADGRSLADFQLYQKLFKYRCSYMVYSNAFKDLPPRVARAVKQRMKSALAGESPAVNWLKASERRKISTILAETLPDW
ncbi:MAG: hypothetical protein V4640_13620 [Verrucomicrobiota bacterium]